MLLEAGRLGHGTSITSFAWLNAGNKPPQQYHALNMHGMAEYLTLEKELGGAPWMHIIGNVEWDGSEGGAARLREKVERLHSWGYPVELLPIEELQLLEPDMVAPEHIREFAHFPTEGYIDPVYCITELAAAARRMGATIRSHCRVTELLMQGERVTGVMTADGDRIEADIVISCTGYWTDEFARLAGIEVEMAPRTGLIAISAPTDVRLRSAHRDDIMFIRPDGAGRIMMRHYDFDDMVTIDTPVDPLPEFLPQLVERVSTVLPGLAGTPIESVRIGVRPVPGDGYTIIGPTAAVAGLYLIASHSSITMGALFGRLAAREILTDEMDPRLASFRPDRLTRQASLA
jgi:glycine/D-amino acid oxidase-like deaminating enzyme